MFFDPDNGIKLSGAGQHGVKAAKYVYADDLAPYLARSQTIVVYHHLGRHKPADAQARDCADAVRSVGAKHVRVLPWRCGTARLYVIASAPHEQRSVHARADTLLARPWRNRFIDRTP